MIGMRWGGVVVSLIVDLFAWQWHEQRVDGAPSLVGVTCSRILQRIDLNHQNFLKLTERSPNQRFKYH